MTREQIKKVILEHVPDASKCRDYGVYSNFWHDCVDDAADAILDAMPAPVWREPLVKAAQAILNHRDSIMTDIQSAHSNRGGGASEWMREDDRDFRADLRTAFDELNAALTTPHPEQPEPIREADLFDKQEFYYRDYDPDDSGETPHEALRHVMLLGVSLVHSSTRGPSRFCFTSETLNPNDDEQETLCFDTEEEARAAVEERREALRALEEGA